MGISAPMMVKLLFGVGAVILGLYGFLNPDRGRAWGSTELWKENPEDAKAYTVRMNRVVSMLILLVGLAFVLFSLIR